jgi:hypothetical protein
MGDRTRLTPHNEATTALTDNGALPWVMDGFLQVRDEGFGDFSSCPEEPVPLTPLIRVDVYNVMTRNS